MKLYILGYIFSLLFAFSPNCASSQMNKPKTVPASAAPTSAVKTIVPTTATPPSKDSASDLI